MEQQNQKQLCTLRRAKSRYDKYDAVIKPSMQHNLALIVPIMAET